MPCIEGIVLLAQESRLRLLADDGRGHVLLLPPDAALEPQDLPALVGARIRVDCVPAPRLAAGIIRDLLVTPA
jgi:hypothetical protein